MLALARRVSRSALLPSLVAAVAVSAPAARADIAAVIVAEVEGSTRHDALIELAGHIAHAQRIDRPRQAQTWQARIGDGYQPATVAELDEAATIIGMACTSYEPGGYISPGRDAPRVRQAAAILARAVGVEPGASRAPYGAWERFESAARRATMCLRDDVGATRTAVLPATFHPTVATDRTPPQAYVDGVPVAARTRDGQLVIDLPTARDSLVHLRCHFMTRCSPLVRVPAGGAISAPLALVNVGLRDHVRDDLTLTYPSAYDQNERVGRDASDVAIVVGGGTADVLTVFEEGPGVRLLLSDPVGAPLRSLRADWPDAVDAARRLVAGEWSQPIQLPLEGLHTVVFHELPGAPRLVTGETPFDPTPTALRSFCRDRDCRFAAPPGRLRLTLRRQGLADDELVRSIKLDSDLEITSVPGRRYAAKYLGDGLLIAGGGTALATTLVMGLIQKLGESACDVATSGPDDCDDRSFTSDTAAAVFFAGVGTAAVGAVLRFVVHKRPSLRIKKISRD
mgnify:CR=1 FL=1